MTVGAVDAHFAVAELIFGQANGDFARFGLQTPVQDKRLLLMANNATNLQAAKRPTMPEGVDRLQHAGLPAAVSAHQKVKARGEREIRAFDIAEIFNQ